MNPYYQDKWVTILLGDSREIPLSDASAIVTDPPYGLEFMGKEWDRFSGGFSKNEDWEHGNLGGLPRQRHRNIKCPDCGKWIYDHPPRNCICGGVRRSQMLAYEDFCIEWARLARKACLPGAPLLSFGGTRTFHRIACAIEDAGWEIRDTLMWVYGQGFPKSESISIALDKQECRKRLVDKLGRTPSPEEFKAEWAKFREVVSKVAGMGKQNPEWNGTAKGRAENSFKPEYDLTSPATPEAQLWEGYGTALKPAYEPIILAMNPLDGTFANNALKHGVAGLNIDGTRIPMAQDDMVILEAKSSKSPTANYNSKDYQKYGDYAQNIATRPNILGRFPSNFIHDGSQMVMELFPESKSTGGRSGHTAAYSGGYKREYYGDMKPGFGDNGSAARFFYCAKASKAERDRGLEEMAESQTDSEYRPNDNGGAGLQSRLHGATIKGRNNHPTVKPLALMEYLVKLVKMPEYNLIIDPFMGSGTTLLACIRLGIPCIGIDNDEKACEIAAHRCSQEVMELV